jgi:hypothetical protein
VFLGKAHGLRSLSRQESQKKADRHPREGDPLSKDDPQGEGI